MARHDASDLKKFIVGGLTTVVPGHMVVVDTRFPPSSNLYEGMPQEAKLLYLMRSLTPSPWARAIGDGLSIVDCRGEQTLVFDSIVPNTLRYSMGTIEKEGSISGSGKPEDQRTLVGDARRGVRLRVVRHLELGVALRNGQGSSASSMDDDRKVGTRLPLIDDARKGEFGHEVLVSLPTAQRPSRLNLRTSVPGATIPFKTRENVRDLLARIAVTTGFAVMADPHYRSREVVEDGSGAAARDLLAALALGIGGTYRRVGSAYVLTNDLDGMAAQQARITSWEDALTKEVQERVAQGDPRQRLLRQDPVLEPGLRETDGRRTGEPRGERPRERQRLPADRPGELRYRERDEELPRRPRYRPRQGGDHVLHPLRDRASRRLGRLVGGLARQREPVSEDTHAWTPPNPASVALPLSTTPRLGGLILHADTPDEARARVERVANLGIGSLWLETNSADALVAVVEAGRAKGVEVTLAARPWSASPGERIEDPDRSAVGEHGASLAAEKATLLSWLRYFQNESAYEPSTRERLAPLSPRLRTHVTPLVRLASTPGLDGVALLDLYAIGYAKADSRMTHSSFYSIPVDDLLSYGYSDAQRAAFSRLRASIRSTWRTPPCGRRST